MLILTVFFFSPARCVCLTMYTSKWLFKNGLSEVQSWTSWGYFLFGSRYLRSALNVQFHAPPPSELSSHPFYVSSSSNPFAVSHQQHRRHHPHHYYHHHHFHYHYPIRNSNFSTSICPVPNGTMKVTGSSIHRYRKSDFEVCTNIDRVFSPHDVCVR